MYVVFYIVVSFSFLKHMLLHYVNLNRTKRRRCTMNSKTFLFFLSEQFLQLKQFVQICLRSLLNARGNVFVTEILSGVEAVLPKALILTLWGRWGRCHFDAFWLHEHQCPRWEIFVTLKFLMKNARKTNFCTCLSQFWNPCAHAWVKLRTRQFDKYCW